MRPWMAAVAMGIMAGAMLAIASRQFALVPGMPLLIAPLFYILAYRMHGIGFGVAAALLFTLPTCWWWGHPGGMGAAALHVAFLHHWHRSGRMLSDGTLMFGLLAAGAFGVILLARMPGVMVEPVILFIAASVLSATACAAFVDLAELRFVRGDGLLEIRRAPPPSLVRTVNAYAGLFLVLSTLAMVALEARETAARMRSGYTLLVAQVHAELEERAEAMRRMGADEAVAVDVRLDHGATRSVWVARSIARLRAGAALQTPDGCPHLVSARDIDRLDPWTDTFRRSGSCLVGTAELGGGRFYFLQDVKSLAKEAYHVLIGVLGVILAAWVAARLALRRLSRDMTRAARGATRSLRAFGAYEPPHPGHVQFKEFNRAVELLAASNKNHMVALSERQALRSTLELLRSGVGLEFIRDVEIHPEKDLIRFVRVENDADGARGSLLVHPGDRVRLREASSAHEAMIEFRTASEDRTCQWYVALLRNSNGGRFASGVLCRIREPRSAATMMLQQARLAELGAMSSAIIHELRQPLSTIALAADNGAASLEAASSNDARAALAKFAKIRTQVDRISKIAASFSAYARIDEEPAGPIPVGEPITAVLAYMEPLAKPSHVDFQFVPAALEQVRVRIAPIALEQVIVNGLQNAIDAVTGAGGTGGPGPSLVRLSLAWQDGEVVVRIDDDGPGITDAAAAMAFEPFFTTKGAGKGMGLGLFICRQILMNAGGGISIRARAEGGTRLEVRLPALVEEKAQPRPLLEGC